jgi:hypothetical protein
VSPYREAAPEPKQDSAARLEYRFLSWCILSCLVCGAACVFCWVKLRRWDNLTVAVLDLGIVLYWLPHWRRARRRLR